MKVNILWYANSHTDCWTCKPPLTITKEIKEMKTREFYIAGVQFHDAKKVINHLKVGDILLLNPDPENKWDANAVEILFIGTPAAPESIMLGFVPKKFAGEVSAAIEISDMVTCTITEVTPSAKPWEQIKVEIKDDDGYTRIEDSDDVSLDPEEES